MHVLVSSQSIYWLKVHLPVMILLC